MACILRKGARKIWILHMDQVNWEMDCLDANRESDPEDGLYTKEEYEETMKTLRARFSTMNFDTIDPRFIHPFTTIIAGPSSSGKSNVLYASNT